MAHNLRNSRNELSLWSTFSKAIFVLTIGLFLVGDGVDEDGLVTAKLSLPVPLLVALVLGAAEVRFSFGCFFFVGEVFSLATDRFFISCTISCLSKLDVGE